MSDVRNNESETAALLRSLHDAEAEDRACSPMPRMAVDKVIAEAISDGIEDRQCDDHARVKRLG